MAIHHYTSTFTIMGTTSHQTSPPSSSSHQQPLFSNPLFSSIVTLYILVLLYFPQIFIKTILSPILVSTLILLLSLLRLGASQQIKQTPPPPQPTNVIKICEGANAPLHDQNQNQKRPQSKQDLEPEPKPEPTKVDLVLKQEKAEAQCNKAEAQLALEPNQNVDENQSTKECLGKAKPESKPKPAYSSKILLEWDVGAPLEVIYEAYEGEEGGEEVQNDEFWRNACCNNKEGKVEKYPSLSRYYPETDSDSDSDDEAERDGLIEIALDYGFGDKRIINVMMKVAEKKEKEKEQFYFDDHEEDNLIEIDISSTKNMYDFAW